MASGFGDSGLSTEIKEPLLANYNYKVIEHGGLPKDLPLAANLKVLACKQRGPF